MEYVEHAYREAPDTDGKQRKAIVFHLRPVGTLAPDSAVVAAALSYVRLFVPFVTKQVVSPTSALQQNGLVQPSSS